MRAAWISTLAFAFVPSLIPAADKDEPIFAPDAKLKVLAANGSGGEGPAWHPGLGVLTSGKGHICRLDRDGKSSDYRKDVGSNGMLFDPQGRLLVCDSDGRRMVR